MSQTPLFGDSEDEDLNASLNSVNEMENTKKDNDTTILQNQNGSNP